MTPAELMALAQQLLYDCCDPVTGEPLYTGQSSYACVEDVEAAARYLRDCAEAEPVATVPHGWKLVPIAPTPEMLATTSWPGCAATDYAHMLAAAPQPPSAQAEVGEALRRLVSAIIDDDGGDDDGNAPGHAHETPGVWDDDNSAEIAGKACELCAAWNHARAVLAAHDTKENTDA